MAIKVKRWPYPWTETGQRNEGRDDYLPRGRGAIRDGGKRSGPSRDAGDDGLHAALAQQTPLRRQNSPQRQF